MTYLYSTVVVVIVDAVIVVVEDAVVVVVDNVLVVLKVARSFVNNIFCG